MFITLIKKWCLKKQQYSVSVNQYNIVTQTLWLSNMYIFQSQPLLTHTLKCFSFIGWTGWRGLGLCVSLGELKRNTCEVTKPCSSVGAVAVGALTHLGLPEFSVSPASSLLLSVQPNTQPSSTYRPSRTRYTKYWDIMQYRSFPPLLVFMEGNWGIHKKNKERPIHYSYVYFIHSVNAGILNIWMSHITKLLSVVWIGQVGISDYFKLFLYVSFYLKKNRKERRWSRLHQAFKDQQISVIVL